MLSIMWCGGRDGGGLGDRDVTEIAQYRVGGLFALRFRRSSHCCDKCDGVWWWHYWS